MPRTSPKRDSKAAREARRKAFAKAQKDGLSLREIGSSTSGESHYNHDCEVDARIKEGLSLKSPQERQVSSPA